MRLNSRWLAVLIILAVMPLSGCGFMNKLHARDYLNKGVKAFTDQKYDAATQYFQKTIELDPSFETARMYLATAYTSQFVPGSTDPKSEEMAKKAIETFTYVVENPKDPAKPNLNAMLSIASLYYQLKNYPNSKIWCDKVLVKDPKNAEAYYRVAVMDYDDVFEKTGIQGENVEFMNPEEKKIAQGKIDEVLKYIANAVEVRPSYFDALEYQNLLWREKAKFETNAAAKAALIREADKVALKSLELRRKAQEEDAKKPKKTGTGKGTE
jgi:tetratricopeptide (TPR) repeat protein